MQAAEQDEVLVQAAKRLRTGATAQPNLQDHKTSQMSCQLPRAMSPDYVQEQTDSESDGSGTTSSSGATAGGPAGTALSAGRGVQVLAVVPHVSSQPDTQPLMLDVDVEVEFQGRRYRGVLERTALPANVGVPIPVSHRAREAHKRLVHAPC
jgi:hypothetical protein